MDPAVVIRDDHPGTKVGSLGSKMSQNASEQFKMGKWGVLKRDGHVKRDTEK